MAFMIFMWFLCGFSVFFLGFSMVFHVFFCVFFSRVV